ncbi:response regulator [Pokkaliibacter sp. MBI-7]|uniref:response regulator n=1 Tax=Pokkaliibacter sp. MBI-7 TaxID=3040600 RepID=UPI00244B3C04|nr:response regulator [Pokkaliibacter sp. MBI-7]MDH2432390.1 response regulator [Pokkaliibacter sp. MBI-7]
MPLIDYNKKRFLVIDDLVEARSMVRDTLKEAGASKIDVAMSANAAMEYLRTRHYDLILSDYNLGRGKDGQQILEEARHNRLVPHTAAFIMITAETSPEMVMGALEYQPDGYISKPFTRAELRRRIDRMLQQKEQMREVNVLLDRQDWASALQLTEALLDSKPQLAGKLLRIKGTLMLELEYYDDARRFYAAQLKDRHMPWALFGLARACFHMHDYDKAVEYLQKLMLDNQYFVKADDWMAKTLTVQGDYRGAENILLAAIAKSPKAVLRQMELGKVAALNKDWTTSEQGFKRAIMLANHSVYRCADNYLGFIEAVLQQLEAGQTLPKATLNQVEESLNTLDNDFKGTATDALRSRYQACQP